MLKGKGIVICISAIIDELFGKDLIEKDLISWLAVNGLKVIHQEN